MNLTASVFVIPKKEYFLFTNVIKAIAKASQGK